MFFFIDHTVEEAAELDEGAQALFTTLALAREKEKCALHGHRGSLERLAGRTGATNLGTASQKIYGILADRGSDRGFLKIVSPVFVLTFSTDRNADNYKKSLPKELQKRADACRFLPIGECLSQNWRLHEPAALTGEYYTDCGIFKKIAEWYCEQKSIKGIGIYADERSGSGGNIESVLERIVSGENLRERLPTLCIVDSDVRYGGWQELPEPKEGDTRMKARNAKKRMEEQNKLPLFDVMEMDVHEIENLIPLHLLRNILEQKKIEVERNQKNATGKAKKDTQKQANRIMNQLNLLNELLKWEKGKCKEYPILYYDLKDGISGAGDMEDCQREYWKRIFNCGNNNLQRPAIGREIRNEAFKNLNAKTNLHEEPYLKSHWEKIGKAVLSWCCTGGFLSPGST